VSQRVLFIASDGAEDLDSMYPIFRLREAGYDVEVAAPTTRPVKLVVHDFDEAWDGYIERPGRSLPVDLSFEDADPDDYVGLVVPGGRAPEYMRTLPQVRRIVTRFFERDVPVGTICHGPLVPAAFGLLNGRTTASTELIRADMENAGATWVDGPDVVDGNMVSCRGWPDLPEWSRAFMRVLEGARVPA
jgi:protease I